MRAFVVDAFTDTAFAGNPAGVVMLDKPARDDWMQSVAAEFRHAETAFVANRGDGAYDLRWFTPEVEVDLCGHATLATTHVLATIGSRGPFVFITRSGPLRTDVTADGDITLDFPLIEAEHCDVPDGLVEALGVTPVSVQRTDLDDVLVEVASAATVRALTPDIHALRAVECRGVIVTAAGDGDADFVSRFFAPQVGVGEDPVTGSAHCALAPFWASRFGRTSLVGAQLSPRGGRVAVEIRGSTVVLRGRAVTVLDGSLRV